MTLIDMITELQQPCNFGSDELRPKLLYHTSYMYIRYVQLNQKSDFLTGHQDSRASRYVKQDSLFKNFSDVNSTTRPHLEFYR